MNPIEQSAAYPNAASLDYLRGFVAGAEMAGLCNIPDPILSKAIDYAIGASWPALKAGKSFAVLYAKLVQRREPRGGYSNWFGYLLSSYWQELNK